MRSVVTMVVAGVLLAFLLYGAVEIILTPQLTQEIKELTTTYKTVTEKAFTTPRKAEQEAEAQSFKPPSVEETEKLQEEKFKTITSYVPMLILLTSFLVALSVYIVSSRKFL